MYSLIQLVKLLVKFKVNLPTEITLKCDVIAGMVMIVKINSVQYVTNFSDSLSKGNQINISCRHSGPTTHRPRLTDSCVFNHALQVMPLNLCIEFAGGAELLFDKVKTHNITLPDRQDLRPWNIELLISWITVNLLKERPELFVLGSSVRPGILVLVNNMDWEILGQLNYELQDGDCVVFISTLHGG